ncbi:aldehyde dehydrogenase family protein (plasmid) [Embleya sp. NBC_00888]|uniref:aldehyde dehydrogenase family protein n=1 Tax=Embleya sp. NBC_00888 TaxID=2975960 RepID=UPI002F90AC3D|nr:aldehyde dehydrogenase family protein [Embleya sp. NBC_00888]
MSDTSVLDRDLTVLRAGARAWVHTPLDAKRMLLERLRADTARVLDEWVAESCRGKGIEPNAPAAGEEWLSGPYALLGAADALIRLLSLLESGRNPLDSAATRTVPGGRIAVDVFPFTARDRIMPGYTGQVWLRPGVTLEQAKAGIARRLRDRRLPGEVGLVLGAGNVNSIPALDALSKLYQDNAVVLIKLNPVNAYLAPVLERVFAGFVERGFVRITSGGATTGSYLVDHPAVDTVHITGSRGSHDAIVFGPGDEGTRRRARGEPLLTKPVSSELGGVGPAIVVPGRWSEAALKLQARHLATQRLHNSGFNCVATQVVVLPRHWPQADRFLHHLRRALVEAPARPAFYPGAATRQRMAVDSHSRSELLRGDPAVPRTLLTDLDWADRDEPAFATEYFGPVLGITRLPADSPADFLDRAVDFCNDRLAGDLGAGVIADPRTVRRLGPAFDAAIARLCYGTIAVNCWAGVLYTMPRATWGAFPGHDVRDAGSGVGVVHNGLLLDPDHVERTVGRGPFRPWPTPPWFVSHRNAHAVGRHLTGFAAEPSLAKALPKALAALVSSLGGQS